ncbi:MAG: aminoacyl-histidine dipeptidase [Candidatus Thermoplasmatota archaeon]|nr:aminoacyl-histidine dipeptidase [Candidatus Thermoplasmatota archaeon]
MSNINDLKPKLLWKHFDEIRKIPHCSKHEEKIRDYIINFSENQKLKYKQDKTGNIVIYKTANPGFEKNPTIILQGHMDMVCEKNSDIKHDFLKDPIKLKINNDVLTADGTTLGADNGIGVATSLAILEDNNLKLGAIEALFTVDEETGLTGAFALENNMLTGKKMLNLDSEDFGVITVGCAGGGDSQVKLEIKTKNASDDLENLLIKIYGLRGGHSGVDAREQRGNAIKILARLLWNISNQYKIFLSDIKGGDKHNANPREAHAKISVPKKDKEEIIKDLRSFEKNILEEIRPIDPNMKVSIESIEKTKIILDEKSTESIINLLHSLPHGVEKMSYDIKGLVETSTNLATVSIKNNSALIGLSSRSSIASALQDLRDRIHAISSLAGAKVTEGESYPGWKPNLNSDLLKLSKKIFKDMYKKEAVVEAIHAGLECGIIGEKFSGMDMISVGPTIKYPHSPEEQVHISTVDKFYQYVLEIIRKI